MDEFIEKLAEEVHDFLRVHPAWTGYLVVAGPYSSLSDSAKERRRAIASFALTLSKKEFDRGYECGRSDSQEEYPEDDAW